MAISEEELRRLAMIGLTSGAFNTKEVVDLTKPLNKRGAAIRAKAGLPLSSEARLAKRRTDNLLQSQLNAGITEHEKQEEQKDEDSAPGEPKKISLKKQRKTGLIDDTPDTRPNYEEPKEILSNDVYVPRDSLAVMPESIAKAFYTSSSVSGVSKWSPDALNKALFKSVIDEVLHDKQSGYALAANKHIRNLYNDLKTYLQGFVSDDNSGVLFKSDDGKWKYNLDNASFLPKSVRLLIQKVGATPVIDKKVAVAKASPTIDKLTRGARERNIPYREYRGDLPNILSVFYRPGTERGVKYGALVLGNNHTGTAPRIEYREMEPRTASQSELEAIRKKYGGFGTSDEDKLEMLDKYYAPKGGRPIQSYNIRNTDPELWNKFIDAYTNYADFGADSDSNVNLGLHAKMRSALKPVIDNIAPGVKLLMESGVNKSVPYNRAAREESERDKRLAADKAREDELDLLVGDHVDTAEDIQHVYDLGGAVTADGIVQFDPIDRKEGESLEDLFKRYTIPETVRKALKRSDKRRGWLEKRAKEYTPEEEAALREKGVGFVKRLANGDVMRVLPKDNTRYIYGKGGNIYSLDEYGKIKKTTHTRQDYIDYSKFTPEQKAAAFFRTMNEALGGADKDYGEFIELTRNRKIANELAKKYGDDPVIGHRLLEMQAEGNAEYNEYLSQFEGDKAEQAEQAKTINALSLFDNLTNGCSSNLLHKMIQQIQDGNFVKVIAYRDILENMLKTDLTDNSLDSNARDYIMKNILSTDEDEPIQEARSAPEYQLLRAQNMENLLRS